MYCWSPQQLFSNFFFVCFSLFSSSPLLFGLYSYALSLILFFSWTATMNSRSLYVIHVGGGGGVKNIFPLFKNVFCIMRRFLFIVFAWLKLAVWLFVVWNGIRPMTFWKITSESRKIRKKSMFAYAGIWEMERGCKLFEGSLRKCFKLGWSGSKCCKRYFFDILILLLLCNSIRKSGGHEESFVLFIE